MNDLSLLDIFSFGWFAACWFGYNYFSEVSSRSGNLLAVMNEYRRYWMHQMLARDNRMVDASLIGNLLRSISFFASTSIFIVLGLITLLKYRTEATGILTAIPYATPASPILWEGKIFLLVILFVYTFFKYTWSLRQYNYACVLVGAAPPAGQRNAYYDEYADNAARLVGNAAKHFNVAMRAYYFGLAALAWFVNSWLFVLATTWVVMVIYRREFRSHALHYLTNPAIFQEMK